MSDYSDITDEPLRLAKNGGNNSLVLYIQSLRQ